MLTVANIREGLVSCRDFSRNVVFFGGGGGGGGGGIAFVGRENVKNI